MQRLSFPLFGFLGILATACASEPASAPPAAAQGVFKPKPLPDPGKGSLIVGVTTTPGDIPSYLLLSAVLRTGDQVVHSEQVPITSTPFEFSFLNYLGGTNVEISLELVSDNSPDVWLKLARTTRIVPDKTLLLRATIEDLCIAPWFAHQSCGADQTCMFGHCQDAFVDPVELETYYTTWNEDDICKLKGAGAPELSLGKWNLFESPSDYAPINDLEMQQIHEGGQGGIHIWLSLHAKNLTKDNTILTFQGQVPDLGQAIGPFTFVGSFYGDHDGYCKYLRYPFRLDETLNPNDLLGKTIVVQTSATDEDGASSADEKTVVLSQDITPLNGP